MSTLFTFLPEDRNTPIIKASLVRQPLASGGRRRWVLIFDLWIGADGWHANVKVAITFDDADEAAEALVDITQLGLELTFEDSDTYARVEDGCTYFGRPVLNAS